MISQIQDFSIPDNLRQIHNPPKKLRIRGTMPKVERLLCVIGSRDYTDYGRSVCIKLIEGLKGQSVAIVSGLALGIDSIAHQTALRVGIPTIAIPGSGLDDSSIYPRTHLGLAHQIINNGGCLISEFDDNTKGNTWTFPQRNRIMAGLSDTILVIEANIKSGTLITSKLAIDYNRTVMAVPGSILSKQSEGPHMLIRLGAIPIRSSEDILEGLGVKYKTPLTKGGEIEKLKSTCSNEELIIINALENPKEKDELIYELNMPIAKLNATLSLLEIKGITNQKLGKIQLSLFD